VNGCANTTSMPSRSGRDVGYQTLRKIIVAVNRRVRRCEWSGAAGRRVRRP